MAYTGEVAERPLEVSGGLQSWEETTDPNALNRSKMEDGQTIKTRRKVTAPLRAGQATVTVPAAEAAFWRDWYEVRCQTGSLPTKFKFPPNCAEQIWRFSTPLTYRWIDNNACQIAFGLEKLPQWTDV